MSPIIAAAASGLIKAGIEEFLAWRARRARDAAWKPSPKDVDDFLKEIEADTPEALKAKVAAELGVPWPPLPPTP